MEEEEIRTRVRPLAFSFLRRRRDGRGKMEGGGEGEERENMKNGGALNSPTISSPETGFDFLCDS